MIKIYHNPRCKKSRAGLHYLESKTKDFETVQYLKEMPSREELKTVIAKTGMPVEELIRKQEDVFKKNFKGKKLSDDEWIDAMMENPKLIQRPLVVKDDQAVLGDPAENIEKLF